MYRSYAFLSIKGNLLKNKMVYLHLGGPVRVATVMVLVVVGAKLRKQFLLERSEWC